MESLALREMAERGGSLNFVLEAFFFGWRLGLDTAMVCHATKDTQTGVVNGLR